MTIRRQLVIMVKDPRPGRVKTRLAEGLGHIGAVWWFRHQSHDLIRRLKDPRWSLTLAVAPHAGLDSRALPPAPSRVAQGSGDLGARMLRVFRTAPPGPVCIIGADIPGITPRHVAQAFGMLGQHDAVFGPAFDGGYWLIGLHRTAATPSTLLRNVRWSTPHALADSVNSLPGARIGFAAKLRDIDTVDDLA